MIPEETIRQIQDQLDIVEVIGGYLELKKAGRNFKGLCPFHPEKTPSFMVYPQKQFFICYGCGAGGDLIAFVMKHEHLEFAEAVEVLAQKAGVTLTQVGGGRAKKNPDLYRAHEVAAEFYQELLISSPEGKAAREYLKARGLTEESWKKFGLGFAPTRWDGFLKKAQAAGFKPELLERAGLVIAKDDGKGWYDRFRNRVMFPIWDSRGKVIAFSGRILEESGGPKYMNSPETELYVKGRVLYGLHLAAPQIREQDFCIVVEGNMDLVTPHQHGFGNVVASMGTSLTEQQVKLIRRQTRHVVMVYDGDYAGELATLRGLDLLLEAEMRVKVATLPGGSDPDTLIREQGPEVFAKVIQGSQELFDYKLGVLMRKFDAKTLEGRVQISQEMLPTLKRVPNAIQQGEYVRRLSEALEVEEALLWKEMGRVKRDASWKPTGLTEVTQAAAQHGVGPEELLAGLLLEKPDRVTQIEGRLELQDLKSEQIRNLIQQMIQLAQDQKLPRDHRQLVKLFPEAQENWEARTARWLAEADTVTEKDQAMDELLDRIRASKHRASIEDLQGLIQKAEAEGNTQRAEELILEINQLIKSNAAEHVLNHE